MTPIDMFPDDVLLEIFDVYVGENPEAWQQLVHVCRRWRCLVFASSRRLNVRIVCTLERPIRDLLDIWPILPILVQGQIYKTSPLDNIIAVLGHRNRVSGINLWDLASSQLTEVLAAMNEPFPELMDLHLRTFDEIAPLDPDLFLGGSAPRLRYLQLESIPYPGLPKLLMSATHIVSLRLYDIPHSGYISPEAMVTCLSQLTSLEILCLEFRPLQSHLDWEGQRLPLPTRSIIPALIYFHFRGVGEYLEDLTSRINAPRLNYVSINFTGEIGLDSPYLSQFISRTPALKALDKAHVTLDDNAGGVTLSSKVSAPGHFNVEIPFGASEWQLSALSRICNLSLPPVAAVEDLYIDENLQLNWDYPTESEEWLELLKPYISVKRLYLSDHLSQRIAPALRLLVGDRVTEVLPTLENIFLEKPQSRPSVPYKEGIEQFISPEHPPNLYSHSPQPWNPSLLDHEQDFTAPPSAPQLDWQNFPLEGPQPSGPSSLQEDTWQFILPQQSEPQGLHLDRRIEQSGLSDGEGSEQHSFAAQLPLLYDLYSEESQASGPFQEGGWSDPQNAHLDWLQPASGPFHELEGFQQQSSSTAQLPTLQNLYSEDSQPQPSGSFQREGDDWPDLQNLHLDYWSQQPPLPELLFHEDGFEQHSSAQSTLQSLESEDYSQPPRPILREDRWPDPQNVRLEDVSQHWQHPSGLFLWEECIAQFVAARQKTAHPVTISFWERTNV